ncbi:hypothetical protein PV783_14290 [Chitinophaga sp. CC14]|uniref:hypothetical protein n=1 Tax=Chitinophaga sp. CC14 TaxID=3029199 RepID=UPI003B7CE936
MPFTNLELLSLCLLLLAGCVHSPSPGKKTLTADTVALPAEQHMIMPAGSRPVDIEEDSMFIPADAEIRILTATKTVTGTRYPEYIQQCNTWKLSNPDIEKIFRNSQPAENAVIHYLYSTMECEVRGQVMINGDTYQYIINAGSWFRLYNRHHSYSYSCSAENCRYLFLEHEEEHDGK